MLAELVAGDTTTTAWVRALARLVARGGESFDLLVAVENPDPALADPRIIALLDQVLTRRKVAVTRTVGNTIFPEALACRSPDRETLYSRYRDLLPRLKRIDRNNRRGTYFGRLIGFPLQDDPARANQIETVIRDLRTELGQRRRGPFGHIYEAQVFVPGQDRRPMGFPCLSSLSFHLDHGRLRLSATYRNQYYVRKALGNFVGLAHLQRFVAVESGIEPGVLSVHAFHAQVDPDIGQREVTLLLHDCQELVPGRIADARIA